MSLRSDVRRGPLLKLRHAAVPCCLLALTTNSSTGKVNLEGLAHNLIQLISLSKKEKKRRKKKKKKRKECNLQIPTFLTNSHAHMCTCVCVVCARV